METTPVAATPLKASAEVGIEVVLAPVVTVPRATPSMMRPSVVTSAAVSTAVASAGGVTFQPELTPPTSVLVAVKVAPPPAIISSIIPHLSVQAPLGTEIVACAVPELKSPIGNVGVPTQVKALLIVCVELVGSQTDHPVPTLRWAKVFALAIVKLEMLVESCNVKSLNVMPPPLNCALICEVEKGNTIILAEFFVKVMPEVVMEKIFPAVPLPPIVISPPKVNDLVDAPPAWKEIACMVCPLASKLPVVRMN